MGNIAIIPTCLVRRAIRWKASVVVRKMADDEASHTHIGGRKLAQYAWVSASYYRYASAYISVTGEVIVPG